MPLSHFQTVKKLLFCFLLLALHLPSYGQHDSTVTDSVKHRKKGWGIGPFPVVGFNSDLGFQYGIYSEIYNFGDGSAYPGYFHKFSVKVSRYTKGSGTIWFAYDSPKLWRNHRVSVDLAWLPDPMLDFVGFNGYATPYHKDRNKSFYKMFRNQFRILGNLQGKITKHLDWYAGISWQMMEIAPIKMEKYRGEDNLYTHYIESGLIGKDEAQGGQVLQWRAGLVYDSRDKLMDATRGVFGEFIVSYAPDIIDRKGYSFAKINASVCYFQPVFKKYITWATRMGAQFVPWGKQPFYFVSNINTSYMYQNYSEGLGGVESLRGVLRNRVVGNGTTWFNTELRFRSPEFRFFKQNWYIGVNPFFDGGAIFQPFRSPQHKGSNDLLVYSGEKERLHLSAGIGGKVVMNQNFVLSAELGIAFDKRDGDYAISLGLNYLF